MGNRWEKAKDNAKLRADYVPTAEEAVLMAKYKRELARNAFGGLAFGAALGLGIIRLLRSLTKNPHVRANMPLLPRIALVSGLSSGCALLLADRAVVRHIDLITALDDTVHPLSRDMKNVLHNHYDWDSGKAEEIVNPFTPPDLNPQDREEVWEDEITRMRDRIRAGVELGDAEDVER
eukprot:TRINITY_DN836_c0_g1_i1.p1 TRINITY_DN836_c0_g1~~TRINITY_DN836_c0_g1_i1.p1  ORF type:complete len:195 (-),score=43.53 TRINITY_DN836_c0_g1_i1:118-651(-)